MLIADLSRGLLEVPPGLVQERGGVEAIVQMDVPVDQDNRLRADLVQIELSLRGSQEPKA